LIESLRRDIPEREAGDFARSVGRLAEIFGAIQGAVTEGIARQRAGDPRRDELTQLPGSAELHEWLQILLAEYRRYGHPFTVALVDIEGLVHINDAYGREAGDRIVAAVGTVIRNQIRTVDRAFRLSDDEFSVLAPHERAERARSMAERLTRVIETSQAADGPRIAITVGVSSCPDNGDEVRGLLAAAEQATYAAKAAGRRRELQRRHRPRARSLAVLEISRQKQVKLSWLGRNQDKRRRRAARRQPEHSEELGAAPRLPPAPSYRRQSALL
jgi:diguanylate cyclase (GGDEF)-like protein